MSSDRRFEQELPGLLDELFMGPMPAYRDIVLDQAGRTRQRPAWSFLERWLPMVDVVRQPVLAPRLPWRAIGLGLILVMLLAALVATLLVGSPPRLPAPFGPAANGLVAYSSAGDIYTANPATGSSTAIVRGPETDANPRWSRDGTRLAFEREPNGVAGRGLVFVVRADGSGLVQVTPDPVPAIDTYAFSPDGKQILVSGVMNGEPAILIAATDGSVIRRLDVGGPATNAAWRPPNGSEILFMDGGDDSNGFGSIHVVDTASRKVRTILAATAGHFRGYPGWSPDGSLISYDDWVDSSDLTVQIHVMRADGSGDRTLTMPSGAVWQAGQAWSNDGTRIVAIRGYSGGNEQSRAVALPVDGSGAGVEIDYPGAIQQGCCTAWEWAPDDTWILGTPTNAAGAALDQVRLDPISGGSGTVTWKGVSPPSIQRVAP